MKHNRLEDLKTYYKELAVAKQPLDPYYKKIRDRVYHETFLKIKNYENTNNFNN